MKMRFVVVVVTLGLMAGGGVVAESQATKPPATKPSAKKANPNWAKEQGACQGLNQKAKSLLAQEKQLNQQAKAKEAEVRALVAQSKQLEIRRVAEEHAAKKGNAAAGTEARGQEGQQAHLEQQVKEKQKERETLVKQADELGKQRREVEAQHKQECTFGKKS